MKPLYFLALGIVLIVSACSSKKEPTLDPATETAYYYLYNRTLYSDTFSRILYQSPIDFRVIDISNYLMYFVFDRNLNREESIMKIAKDTNIVEFAPCETGYCDFGAVQGNVDGIYAVRTPLSNLKVDSNLYFNFRLKTIQDSLNFVQLKGLLDSQLYFTGKAFWEINGQAAKNLRVLVMKKDEQSDFYKFAARIKGNATSNEQIAQRFVDFVVNEIDYSYADFWYKAEIMKRPHEVLLSGFGDCSGKTILLASFLEQYDIPYSLIYYDRHVNVGIVGDYEVRNEYVVELGGKKYNIAETTCPNFKIGKTVLENYMVSDMLYYQIPNQSGKIFDCYSNEEQKLYTYEEAVEHF